MPGYDKSRIFGATDQLDQFMCGICLGIFVDPVVTQCCRQTYCKDCVSEWISNAHNCPNDRKPLDLDGLLSVPRLVVNLIENLTIKCDFETHGCQQAVKIGELAQHLSVCDFRLNQLCRTCGLMIESLLTHNCFKLL